MGIYILYSLSLLIFTIIFHQHSPMYLTLPLHSLHLYIIFIITFTIHYYISPAPPHVSCFTATFSSSIYYIHYHFYYSLLYFTSTAPCIFLYRYILFIYILYSLSLLLFTIIFHQHSPMYLAYRYILFIYILYSLSLLL